MVSSNVTGGGRVRAFFGFARTASRKLDQLDAATGLRDLSRPGNRLEALKGRRKGQWSIRINDQWRICFKWPDGSSGPSDSSDGEIAIGAASRRVGRWFADSEASP